MQVSYSSADSKSPPESTIYINSSSSVYVDVRGFEMPTDLIFHEVNIRFV